MNIRRSLITIAALVAMCATFALADDKGAVSTDMLAKFEANLAKDKDINRVINAVTNNDIKKLSLNRELVAGFDSRFNVKVDGSKIINQKSSGRCWMFAGANCITPRVMSKLDLSDFALSESYLSFWDKIEKSNMFLEEIIRLRDKPLDDRSMMNILEYAVGDGGWWNYFEGLIAKYGIVPASAMPETEQSSKTGRQNSLINTLLRKGAADMRRLHADGKSIDDLRKLKSEILSDVYRLLVCNYGHPPKEFVFRYEEKIEAETADSTADSTSEAEEPEEKKVLVEKSYTPMGFYSEFYGEEMPEYVALCHNPAREFDKLYEFEIGRILFEGSDMQLLNMPIEKLKKYTFESLLDSQIVWFACDVGADNFNDSGMFAINIYDYNATFGLDFNLTKEDRINYWDMSPNHAMAITGADTTSAGVPRKWLVENSWGSSKGNNGYWTMYDNWFDQNVLLVMIDKSRLDEADAKLFDQKPVVIKDWQPFFAMLRNLR